MTLSTDLLVHIGAFFFLLAYGARPIGAAQSDRVGHVFLHFILFCSRANPMALGGVGNQLVLINIFMLAQIYHGQAEFK